MTSLDTIKSMLHMQHGIFTSRCNAAILLSFLAVKKLNLTLSIPDQSGWSFYKRCAESLQIPLEIIKTNDGVIPTDKEYEALICAEPAGYLFGHDLKSLRKQSKLLILDICGSIGRPYLEKALKDHTPDIVVCSFSDWKPLNLGYGGFLGCSNKEIWSIMEAMSDFELVNTEFIEQNLPSKLSSLNETYKKWDSVVKDTLEAFPDAKADPGKAICVFIPYTDDSEKQKILSFSASRNIETTQCPRKIRLLSKGISLEIKRHSL